MKAIILAGGFGTRLQEETTVKPKPMVEIGGRPILWHIMRTFAAQGFDEFGIVLKVSETAFGSGRLVPITRR